MVVTTALFALSGCSTLGIATTKETESIQAWQDSTGQVVAARNARLANLDSFERELERIETESAAAIESLEVRLERAHAWVEALRLEEISERAHAATAAANTANQTSIAVTEAYLQNIIARRDALTAHATEVEAMMDSLRWIAETDSAAADKARRMFLMGDPQDIPKEGN
jgi:hypothetical protein